jgi:hypothetical protein
VGKRYYKLSQDNRGLNVAGSRWELGVVAFYDSLEEYDQFAKLKTAYSSPTTTASQSLVMDDSIISDYTGAPYYLSPSIGGVPGTTLHIGPSSDAQFDGTIERAVVSTVSTNTIVLMSNKGWHNFAVADAKYSIGDPVIIRTIPYGWTPISKPYSNTFAVSPIGRKRNIAINRGATSTSELLTSEDSYKYFSQTGVRIAVDGNGTNTSRGIKKTTPVNSISASIRRYRSSWYYRVVDASPAGSAFNSPRAEISMTAMDGQGAALSVITGESGNVTLTNVMNSYQENVRDWTLDSHLMSGYGDFDSDNSWIWKTGNNFSDSAMNRINRIQIELKLSSGTNVAFDVDDIVIEHCDGTSKEANGYYELDDYPTQGSLSWNIRSSPTSNRMPLANNTMRASITHGNTKPKHVISAQYNAVARQVYDDLCIIEQWQQRGNMICLRPFHEAMPNVMIGFLTLTGFNNEMPDLGRVSFTLQFEEA